MAFPGYRLIRLILSGIVVLILGAVVLLGFSTITNPAINEDAQVVSLSLEAPEIIPSPGLSFGGVYSGDCKAGVKYYDRNNDSRIDREFHETCIGDGNYELLDQNYDGRYEVRTNYGIALMQIEIDIAVPGNE